MKKRNMLTKVAALSMAGLMTLTGLPVAGLDGALAIEAASEKSIDFSDKNTTYELTVGDKGSLGFGSKSGSIVDADLEKGNSVISADYTALDATVGNKDAHWFDVKSKAAFQAVSAGTTHVRFATDVKTDSTGCALTKNVAVAPAKIGNLSSLVVGLEEAGGAVVVTADIAKTTSVKFKNRGAGTLKFKVISATINGYDLDKDDNFDVYVDGKAADTKDVQNAATYQVRVAGKANVTDDKNVTLTIEKPSLNTKSDWKETDWLKNAAAGAVYSVNGAKVITNGYAGALLNGAGTKNVASTVVVSEGNVDITYSNNNKTGTNVGSMKMTAKADANIQGSYTKNFSIVPKELNGEVFTDKPGDAEVASGEFTLPNQVYTGSQIKPSFTLYDIEPLAKYTDSKYDAAYEPTDDDYMDSETDPAEKDKDHAKRYVALTSSDYTVSYDTNKDVGEGHVYVTGKGNYLSSSKVTFTFNIIDKAKDISNAKVTMTKDGNTLANGGNIVYDDGNEIEIDSFDVSVTNKDGGVDDLEEGKDYKVSYKNNKNAGKATVVIEGTGNYGGTVEKNFTITAKDIEDVDDVKNLTVDDVDYTGIAKTPSIKSKLDSLKEGKDYTTSYGNNINAGEHAAITINGVGNYKGKVVKEFTINAADINNDMFDEIENLVYTGSELTPDVVGEYTLGDGEKYTLVKDKDYRLTYDNNTGTGDSSVDSATVNVEGINNFRGTANVSFNIVPATNDLALADITLAEPSVTYDGDYHPAVISSVKIGDKVLTNQDYALVKVVSEKEVGTYTVQIKGTTSGSEYYGGIGETTFEITPKAATVDFKLSATKKTYNGKAQTVKVTNVTRDGVEITEDDYTVSGTTKATNAGKNTVTVTLKGNYSGSAKKTWTIAKAKQTIKVSPASKTFKAKKVKKAKQTFTIKVTGAKGTKSFKSNSKKVTVTKAGKVTVKKGTKKGTYKITVKAAATKNYNAAASKTVTIKVK